jgi:hypothetical protein
MSAFSNGFEFEMWEPNWCGRCIKDEMGGAPEGTFCPILSKVMLNNEVPPQWTPGTDDLRDRYHCSEFELCSQGLGSTPEPTKEGEQ